MSKFCLGTLFTIIKKCVDESFVQHRDIREVFETLSQSYSPEPDMIVHIVGGRKNPAKSFIDEINSYDSSVYGEFSDCMDSVTNHIDPNKVDLLVKMLSTTIMEDEAIQDTTIVDLINGTRKKDLPGQYGNLSSFLAGLFIYAVKYTNNRGSVLSVKAINDQFVAEHMGYVSMSPTIKKSSVEVSELEICEEDELKSKRFLINHENEKELIPLCQIAMIHSPEHKHVRAMYTEFILSPKSVQNYILKASDAESLINLDSIHYGEAIDYFCKDLEEYNLSSQRYLYMFGQYLHRAFEYYSECDISKYDNYSFTRLCKSSPKFLENVGSPIDAYIDDYLWMKDNKMQTDAPPPMDYLWHEKNFGACQEEDLTYWLCRFVIDVCNNLYHRVKKADLDLLYVEDQYAETQEDMYYCALNALYNLYLCHTRVAFNDGVEIKQSL